MFDNKMPYKLNPVLPVLWLSSKVEGPLSRFHEGSSRNDDEADSVDALLLVHGNLLIDDDGKLLLLPPRRAPVVFFFFCLFFLLCSSSQVFSCLVMLVIPLLLSHQPYTSSDDS